MIRHLIPRLEGGRWSGSALTKRPGGGRELPEGLGRNLRKIFGQATTTPVHDDISGGIVTFQWLGIMIEIGVGRVS